MLRRTVFAGIFSGALSFGMGLQALAVPGPVTVPGFSFETPAVNPLEFPVGLTADHWTLVSTGFGNSGTFPNTNPGDPGFPDNSHGDGIGNDQLGYMFTNTGNSFSQTLAAVFEADHQYSLILGVGVGGSFPAPATDKLHFDLGYLTDINNPLTFVPVVTSSITRNPGSDGLANNHLLDLSATTGFLGALDTAVGKQIRIILRTEKFSDEFSGGQFVFDNVRLNAVPEPATWMTLAGLGAIMLRRRSARTA